MNKLLELVWGSPRRALLTTVVLVSVLVLGLAIAPSLRDMSAWLIPFGVVGFFVRQYPNEAKQLAGRFLSHLAWVNQTVERASIRQDLEGTLSSGAAELVNACPDVASTRIRLDFLKSGEQVDELPDGTLVLAITHHKDRARNLAAAAWAFARYGVLQSARPHIDRDLSRGIDFVVARQILSRSDRTAMRYFVEEVWQPAIQDAARLKELTWKLERLQEDELLGPVVFAEFMDLGVRNINRLPTDGIAQETADFVEFLFEISEREAGQEGATDFEGQSIRSKFIFVARADVYAVKGPDPYRNAVKWSITHGFRNIYLLARGKHVEYAIEVARAFNGDNRVFEPRVWVAIAQTGGRTVRRAVVRIPVDVRYLVGIGQRPIVAIGPGRTSAEARANR